MRTKTMMKASQKRPKSRQKERFDFTKKVLSLQLGQKLLCFVDEASFQVNARPKT